MGVAVYAPLNRPKAIATDLWIVDGPTIGMAAPFGLSLPFPTRMTVVRLRDGGLWCHSPIAPDAGLFASLELLGPVRHLVSPNKFHYASIAAWKQRFPAACAWASPGVRERAAAQHIAVDFDRDLGESAPIAWSADLAQLRFRGSRVLEEVVFLHCASASLILADLIENLEAARLSPLWRMLARLGGVLAPDGKAPLDLRLTFTGGRKEARECLAQILAWHPQRVLLAHGHCLLHDGEAQVQRAFRWLQ